MLAVRWILAILAALGAAVSVCLVVIGDWSRDYLTDTDGFVQTLAPMAESRPLQQIIANQAGVIASQAVEELPLSTVIQQIVGSDQDEDQSVSGLWGSIQQLIREPVESAITDIATQVEQVAKDATTHFVTSDAFPPVFNQATADLHSQIVAALRESSDNSAEPLILSLHVDPILEAAQNNVSGPTSWLLSLVPETDQAIPVLEISGLASWRPLYSALGTGGSNFIWIAAILTVLALLVTPRRFATLALTGGFSTAIAGILIWQLPRIGQRTLAAVDPSLNEVVTQAWSRFFTPLSQSLEPIVVGGIAVTLAGVILAVGTRMIRRSRTKTATAQ